MSFYYNDKKYKNFKIYIIFHIIKITIQGMLGEECPPQFVKLVSQFYEQLSQKKINQNIAYEIREFVIQRNDLVTKQQTAKKLLDFFLKLESSIQTKTKQQWNIKCQLAIKKAHALYHYERYAFNNIKQLNGGSKEVFHCEEPCHSSYEQIEIQEEIKLKTQYFNKWCLYVQHSRIFKQIKMKQVENQKISQSFSKYGIKFNYFNAWKKVYRKHKLVKERSAIISKKSQMKILKNCFKSIGDIIEIMKFQEQLVQKIKEKIIYYKKKFVYKQVKVNNSIIKTRSKDKKIMSSCAYIFIKYFCSKLKPLMNRSFQHTRENILQNIDKQLLGKTFKGMKNICKETQQKIKAVGTQKILKQLSGWISYFHQNIIFNNKSNKLVNMLASGRKKAVLMILNSSTSVNIELPNLTPNNEINQKSKALTNINIPKIMFEKTKKFLKAMTKKQQLKILNKLKNIHERAEQKQQQKIKIIEVCLQRFKFKVNISKVRRIKKRLFYQQLAEKRNSVVCKITYKKWRKLKLYHRYEEQKLNSISRCSSKLALLLFWTKFKSRVSQKQSLDKLSSSINTTLLKKAFTLIAGQSHFINDKISEMRNKRNKKLIAHLFCILQKNQSYNSNLAQGIFFFKAKIARKYFLHALRSGCFTKHQVENIETKLEINQTKKFLSRLQSFNTDNKINEGNKEKLRKKLFLKSFKKLSKQQNQLSQQLDKNISKLQNKINELSTIKFINRLQQNKHSQLVFLIKEDKVRNRLIRQNIIKLKQHIKIFHSDINLKKKKQLIGKQRMSTTMKMLMERQKIKKISEKIQNRVFKCSFKDLIFLCRIRKNIKNGVSKFRAKFDNKNMALFYRLLAADKQEIDDKCLKVSYLREYLSQQHRNNMKQSIKAFFTLMKNSKDIKQSTRKISGHRKHMFLSELINISLKIKFYKIKYHFSLKSYAKNLMKKAFKSFKHTLIKIKQKENLLKLDRTSSILVEKSIEKSVKSNTLSEQIQRFNLRKSRQIR